MKKWYDILFQGLELTCMSDSLLATNVAVPRCGKGQFFCINPLYSKRSDSEVTTYRNILVEFDTGTISEQRKMLEESGLPYSILTFSGSKSLHAIISVEPAIEMEEQYRAIAKAIYAKLPGCDDKVFNPSRFSRTPEAIRDNGNEQTLLEIKERVSLDKLLAWLGPMEILKPRLELPKELWGARMMPARVRQFLKFGANDGERNAKLFQNSCELFRAGFTEDEIYDMVLSSPLDLPEREVIACIRSARKATN